ncbi:hypothetical protein T440DRAFT_136060 [Plenodomus tracheiphilus IPT5]|uniref:Uncharacterized protein n=1 Tax=Plenodomus tracheiphilus IPT5 TaxID=1408161 RepID=A0A6A7B1I8_9PLEO|nr:hypothetical protein T440DRAFT_136060 [Plenodomus tracheiphilus IPT5]
MGDANTCPGVARRVLACLVPFLGSPRCLAGRGTARDNAAVDGRFAFAQWRVLRHGRLMLVLASNARCVQTYDLATNPALEPWRRLNVITRKREPRRTPRTTWHRQPCLHKRRRSTVITLTAGLTKLLLAMDSTSQARPPRAAALLRPVTTRLAWRFQDSRPRRCHFSMGGRSIIFSSHSCVPRCTSL